MGFKNFAEYTLTTSCAKKPENVETFLNNLTDKIKILQQKEMDALLEYKKQEVFVSYTVPLTIRRSEINFYFAQKCLSKDIPFDGQLNPSDMKYYQNLRENREFKVDQLKIQEYFPLYVVIEGTFNIYKLLLGLEIEEIQNAPSYHEELRLVRILKIFQ